jgi:hypothetical protein
MMRGKCLRRLLIAWHNFLAKIGGASLQIRLGKRGRHGAGQMEGGAP